MQLSRNDSSHSGIHWFLFFVKNITELEYCRENDGLQQWEINCTKICLITCSSELEAAQQVTNNNALSRKENRLTMRKGTIRWLTYTVQHIIGKLTMVKTVFVYRFEIHMQIRIGFISDIFFEWATLRNSINSSSNAIFLEHSSIVGIHSSVQSTNEMWVVIHIYISSCDPWMYVLKTFF